MNIPVTKRGDFGFAALAGAHKLDIDDIMSNRSYFGLPPSQYSTYSTYRDDAGNIYLLNRIVKAEGGKGRLIIMHNRGRKELFMDNEARLASASSIGSSRTRDGDKMIWKSSPEVKGRPFTHVLTPTSYQWEEEGLVSITGTMGAWPGLHWYLPAREGGMYYVSHIYQATGTILGTPVRGFVIFDQFYLPQGKTYLADPVTMDVEIAWYTWCTQYEDGSFENGHFILGRNRFGVAVWTDQNGNVRVAKEADGFVETDESGSWPKRVEFIIDGERWQYVKDPRGNMPDFKIPNLQTDGCVSRVNEKRKPVVYTAWGETVPERGNNRAEFKDVRPPESLTTFRGDHAIKV